MKRAAPAPLPLQCTSVRLADDLFLVRGAVAAPATKAAPSPTHHIAVLDVSGSMARDLPELRRQLKAKLTTLIGADDLLSLVWFSGRGQCDVLLDGVRVASLADLQAVHRLIDRWLVPVGMTGFLEPLARLPNLIARHDATYAVNLLFMSDGMDNQWPRAEILTAAERVAPQLQAATVVEYGYYADRALLTQLATVFGGSLVFATDFDAYQPLFERALAQRPAAVPLRPATLPAKLDAIGGLVFALDATTRTVRTFALGADGTVALPAEVDVVYALGGAYLGPLQKDLPDPDPQAPRYAALALMVHRMRAPVVASLLRDLGDVALIQNYATCFGKQRYSALVEAATAAAFRPALRFMAGFNPNLVPPDDAPTALDVLHLLAEDPTAGLLIDTPAFRYSRIGRKALDASEHLYVHERGALAALQAKLTGLTGVAEIAAVQAEIAALLATKGKALRFVPDAAPDGYPVAALTWNEARPNVSVLVEKAGTIDLSDFPDCPRMPDGTAEGAPVGVVRTKIWRNYALIKDGLVHVAQLPVRAAPATIERLRALVPGQVDAVDAQTALIELSALPVLNRRTAAPPSAAAFFAAHVAKLRAQAAQKVYNSYMAAGALPRHRADGLAARYGAAAAAWMDGRGLRDGGFSPKTTDAAPTDAYLAKYLDVKIKGYSTLPKVADVKDRIQAKKALNGPARMMLPTIEEVESFLASPFMKKAGDPPAVFAAWLETQQKLAVEEARAWLALVAQTTFALLVGQTWFDGCSVTDTEFTVPIDGVEVPCSATMVEESVPV
jgi:hypothetical protein